MNITEEQAKRAYGIVHAIVDQVFPEGSSPMATQINIHPETGEKMRLLVEEVRKQNE